MQFNLAIDAISKIVGTTHVTTEQDRLAQLSQDIIPRTETALAFVHPGNTNEIQEILKIANQYKIGVWPVSQGKNWGYGGKSPYNKNSIVLVLNRMNKIIDVNEELAYAVIEPGVSFRQLHEHLIRNNINLWLDSTDGPADGSVVGNSLERGVGETDYGDHFGNVCGLEVVLPDGQIFRTGGGEIGNLRSWNTYKWGVGPYLEGLFSQANFGVVVKMGVWLRPIPESFVSCLFELKKSTDFPQLINEIRKLQLHGALQSKIHLINDVATKAVAIENFSDPESTLNGYKFSSWTFAGGVYGSTAHVLASQKIIRKALGPLGRVEFIGEGKVDFIKSLSQLFRRWESHPILKHMQNIVCKKLIGKPLTLLEILPHVHAIEKGYPSDYFVRHAYLKSKQPKPAEGFVDPVRDHCGLIWLGPMVPMSGNEVENVVKVVEALYKAHGFEIYVALMVANSRTAIILFSIFYDKSNLEETQRAEKLYFEIGLLTQKMGYQQYRTSTMFMDKIFAPAPEFKSFCQKMKNAIDPNGIIAPGKYGID